MQRGEGNPILTCVYRSTFFDPVSSLNLLITDSSLYNRLQIAEASLLTLDHHLRSPHSSLPSSRTAGSQTEMTSVKGLDSIRSPLTLLPPLSHLKPFKAIPLESGAMLRSSTASQSPPTNAISLSIGRSRFDINTLPIIQHAPPNLPHLQLPRPLARRPGHGRIDAQTHQAHLNLVLRPRPRPNQSQS